MEEDLKMAREIQLAMLPQQYPGFPAGRPAGRKPAPIPAPLSSHRPGGGRLFQHPAPGFATRPALFICDVMGHGVRSALVTAMVRALVEELRPMAADPGQLLTRINRDIRSILQQTGTPLFTTAFYLVADLETRQITYANAGHPRPFLIHRGPRRRGGSQICRRQGPPRPGPVREHHLPHRLPSRWPAATWSCSSPTGCMRWKARATRPSARNCSWKPCADTPVSIARNFSTSCSRKSRTFAEGHEFTDDVCLVGMEASEKL